MATLLRTFNIPTDQRTREYNDLSNLLFKKCPKKAVRFLVDGGSIICFHWDEKCNVKDHLDPNILKWISDKSCPCLGVIACDSHALPQPLKRLSLATQYAPWFVGSMSKLYKRDILEVYILEDTHMKYHCGSSDRQIDGFHV